MFLRMPSLWLGHYHQCRKKGDGLVVAVRSATWMTWSLFETFVLEV